MIGDPLCTYCTVCISLFKYYNDIFNEIIFYCTVVKEMWSNIDILDKKDLFLSVFLSDMTKNYFKILGFIRWFGPPYTNCQVIYALTPGIPYGPRKLSKKKEHGTRKISIHIM